MATETTKIVVETEITGTQKVTQSLSDLKKELKAAQSSALNGDGQAAKRVAELKDKMDDLKDATKSLQGTGIEKGNQALKNFGEGFKNFDFDKIKLGFKGIGSAMKAIPIFLVAEAVAYLVQNWKELGEGNGIVAKSIQYVNGLLAEAKKGLDSITDALGFTNSALDKFGDTIKANADKTKEALSETTAEFDRQIRVARANGQSTVELEIAKQQAIIDTNLVIAKQIEAFVRAGGELDAEKAKLLTASLDAIKNAKVTELEIEQGHTKKLNDEYNKRRDDKKRKDEESVKDADALFKQLSDEQDKADQKVRDDKAKAQAEADKLEADRAKLRDDMRNEEISSEKKANDEKVAGWEKAEADKQKATEASFQNAQLVTQNLQAISDLAFSVRGAKLKKGSAEEEALMRKQFEINKKLSIAQTVISTIQGARNAYLSLSSIPVVGVPLGIAAAAVATISGLAAIQKINNTKFESSSAPSVDSGGGGGGGSFSGGGSSPTTQAPTTNAQPFTRLNEDGSVQNNQPVIKAIVVETDITNSQKRVGRLENQASFG